MEEQKSKGRAILHDIPSLLTDAEWMSLINKERKGLPVCCGNISELRDQIISIVREGAKHATWHAPQFLRAYRVARDGHDLDQLPMLMKLVREVADSMGYTVEEMNGLPLDQLPTLTSFMEEVNGLPHEGNGE